MPYYYHLHRKIRNKEQRARAAANLIALREQLDKSVPSKDAEDNLLPATWVSVISESR